MAVRDIAKYFSMALDALSKWRLENKKKALDKAVDKAIKEGDQRELETEFGSDNAGRPTKHKLDSLQRRKRDKS